MGIDDDDEPNHSVHHTSKETGNELFVLNMSNSETLVNGFRYIKYGFTTS